MTRVRADINPDQILFIKKARKLIRALGSGKMKGGEKEVLFQEGRNLGENPMLYSRSN